MTIEIRQLVIRAVVQAPPPLPSALPSAPSVFSTTPISGALPSAELVAPSEELVRACVREVMRRLDRARER
jgi:hypothetical protein